MTTMALAVVLLLSAGIIFASGQDHHDDADWCNNHVEVIEPLQEVTSYMNITSAEMTSQDLDDVIGMIFHRMNCDNSEAAFINSSCGTVGINKTRLPFTTIIIS